MAIAASLAFWLVGVVVPIALGVALVAGSRAHVWERVGVATTRWLFGDHFAQRWGRLLNVSYGVIGPLFVLVGIAQAVQAA